MVQLVSYGQAYARALGDEFVREWGNGLIEWNGSQQANLEFCSQKTFTYKYPH